ncbi:MAG: malate synthase G, partial [Mangrovicoccus sp.]|nr:malate synthase G [Mangrovicoccus sp.]
MAAEFPTPIPETYVDRSGLKVAAVLADFVETQAIPGTGIDPAAFWDGFAGAVAELGPRIAAALDERQRLQSEIDAWHRANRAIDPEAYRAFLTGIGYLEVEGPDFTIDTGNIDPEIASLPGPQLVVPITNARYALNAANARWGSLYDALYGTDAMGDLPKGKGFDPDRGMRVIAWSKALLDDVVPLAYGSHGDIPGYRVEGDALVPALKDPTQFAGYTGTPEAPRKILFRNHGLHIVLDVDRDNAVGQLDPAGIADMQLESAISAIMDCEDSVASVDAADKVGAYANWLGLMAGTLSAEFAKGGTTQVRQLNADPEFIAPDGTSFRLKGRALMLVR